MYHKIERTFYVLAAFVLASAFFVASPDRFSPKDTEAFRSQVKNMFADASSELFAGMNPVESFELVYEGTHGFYSGTSIAASPLLDVDLKLAQIPNDAARTFAFLDHSLVSMDEAVMANLKTAGSSIYAMASNVNLPAMRVDEGIAAKNDPVSSSFVALITAFRDYYFPQPQSIETLSYDFANPAGQANLQGLPEVGYLEAIQGEQAVLERAVRPEGSGTVAGASISVANSAKVPWVTLRDNITGELYCVAIYNGETNKYSGECKYDDYH